MGEGLAFIAKLLPKIFIKYLLLILRDNQRKSLTTKIQWGLPTGDDGVGFND